VPPQAAHSPADAFLKSTGPALRIKVDETVAGHVVPKSIRMVVTATSDEGTAEEVSEARFTDWKFDDAAK
jgi:hypothetical protein